eukprot:9227017-Alexandrium_andersonii.AAC.1
MSHELQASAVVMHSQVFSPCFLKQRLRVVAAVGVLVSLLSHCSRNRGTNTLASATTATTAARE